MAGPHHRLKGLLLPVAVLAALTAAGVWVAPTLARLVVHSQRGGQASTARVTAPADVDAFLATTLPELGAGRVVHEGPLDAGRADSGTIPDDARAVTWQVPPGRDTTAVATALRDAARSAGVEVHTVRQDELDAVARVYAGARVRQEIRFIPTLSEAGPLPRPVNRRERPLVALIVRGLGPTAATELARTPVPLTLAVAPFAPYSLPTAEAGAQAWQEILVDLSGPDRAALSPGAVQEALAAVPHATGVLLGTRDPTPAAAPLSRGPLAHGVLVADRQPTALTADLAARLLVPWQDRGRTGDDLRARLHHLARTQGHTALVIDADAPGLPAVLAWAAEANALGIRLVHASEVLRAEDMVGILDEDNPRSMRWRGG